MKKEDLFESIGAIDEELIRRSERQENKKLWVKGLVAAACLAFLCGVALLISGKTQGTTEDNPETDLVARKENEGIPPVPEILETKQPEKFVNAADLFKDNQSSDDNVIEEQALKIAKVPIQQYEALYAQVKSADSSILEQSKGQTIGDSGWYRISGHEDMQYLILEDGENGCSLWEFQYFQSESYPYHDVLQIIYGIESAEDIVQIVSEPATMDNSDTGKAIQAEVGTLTITERTDIETLYRIWSSMTCYGSSRWEQIGLGDDSEQSMHQKVRAGRYLTFVTSQGNQSESLKYTGISGMFYEYGGIAYNRLEEEDKQKVEDILQITIY